jgi:PilZ domain-containing protein
MRRLPPDQMSTMESHILECESCLEKLLRLAQPRDVLASRGAALSIRVLDGSAAGHAGHLLDISRNGMTVRLSEALQPGTLVQAYIGTRIILMAQVRCCTPREGEFHVSVEIKNVFLIPRKDPSSD